MIGKYKNGKLIRCTKCKSENLDTLEYDFEIEDNKIKFEYEVQCMECKYTFKIIDTFIYSESKIKE